MRSAALKDSINEKEAIGYKDVFTQKEYLKLVLANLISRFGDSVDAIAMTWVVYVITGSASWSAIVFAMNRLPSVIVQPLAGPLVEKLNKKNIMVLMDVLRGCLVGIFALTYVLGVVKPWMIISLTLCISTAEAFRIPAGISLTPQIIDMKYYTYASALNSTICTIMELAGMGAAGVIISLFGIGVAIGVDAVTFFTSALIIGLIRYKASPHPEKTEKQEAKAVTSQLKEYLSTLNEGFLYVKNVPVIKNICIIIVIINGIMVPYSALQSPLVSDILKQGSSMLSVLGISLSLGMAIGSAIFPYLMRRHSPLRLLCWGGVAAGATYAGIVTGSVFLHSTATVYGISIGTSLIMGTGLALGSAVVNVQFMKAIPRDYMARIGSISNALGSSAMPVISFIISVAVSFISTGVIFLASGTICAIIFLAIGLLKVKLE